MTPTGYDIPVMRPRLPAATALRPYLDEIDATGWYANSGPLLRRLEGRLAGALGLDAAELACVANGTLGLVLALDEAVGLAPGTGAGAASGTVPAGYCLMPSFTFVATAHAAVSAGLQPWFVDVDPESWALTPALVRAALGAVDGPVVAVLPVAPFGGPVPVEDWDAFSEETRIPVVVDAAGSFDSARFGRSPTMISLHATKVLAAGEGGIVATRDRARLANIRSRSNFGFQAGTRSAVRGGTNAKLSEYAAAVCLASLDAWSETRRDLVRLAADYRAALADLPGLCFAPGWGDGASSTCNVELDRPLADAVIAALADAGIEARQWWGKGCHQEPVFASLPRSPLPVTESLAQRVVGLPFFRDLTAGEIGKIADVVRRALAG